MSSRANTEMAPSFSSHPQFGLHNHMVDQGRYSIYKPTVGVFGGLEMVAALAPITQKIRSISLILTWSGTKCHFIKCFIPENCHSYTNCNLLENERKLIQSPLRCFLPCSLSARIAYWWLSRHGWVTSTQYNHYWGVCLCRALNKSPAPESLHTPNSCKKVKDCL